MKLNITKPVMFFDLETTGTNIMTDRVVEISMIKVMPDGSDVQRTLRVNPERHIPEEATAVHHITDEDVADKPTFRQIAADLARSFEGCDIAGFNSNRFDVPMLSEEFARAGVDFDFRRPRYIDVQTIFHKKEQRTLAAAYRFYCDADLEGAHSANADTRATYEVLMAQRPAQRRGRPGRVLVADQECRPHGAACLRRQAPRGDQFRQVQGAARRGRAAPRPRLFQLDPAG